MSCPRCGGITGVKDVSTGVYIRYCIDPACPFVEKGVRPSPPPYETEAVVRDIGGGCINLLIHRDTMYYPAIGMKVMLKEIRDD